MNIFLRFLNPLCWRNSNHSFKVSINDNNFHYLLCWNSIPKNRTTYFHFSIFLFFPFLFFFQNLTLHTFYHRQYFINFWSYKVFYLHSKVRSLWFYWHKIDISKKWWLVTCQSSMEIIMSVSISEGSDQKLLFL